MRFAIHTVYYQSRKADILRECLIPLARSIGERPGPGDEIERCYLERHWRFGPHVRLCVRTASEAGAGLEDEIAAAALPRIQAYLERAPSREAIDEAAYLRLS